MGSGVSYGNIASDVEEAERAADSTDHEEAATAKLVDEEDEVDYCSDGFDDAEETGGEERGIDSGNTDGFEDCGAVVVDGVDSGKMLVGTRRM